MQPRTTDWLSREPEDTQRQLDYDQKNTQKTKPHSLQLQETRIKSRRKHKVLYKTGSTVQACTLLWDKQHWASTIKAAAHTKRIDYARSEKNYVRA